MRTMEQSVPNQAMASEAYLPGNTEDRISPVAHRAKKSRRAAPAYAAMSGLLSCLRASSCWLFSACHDEETVQDCKRRRWIAGYFHVDGEDHTHATSRHEALPENTPRDGTSADSQNTLRIGHRFIGLQQRPPHILTYRPNYEQDIGSPRSGGQKDAQPVHVVQRIVQLLDLVQAGSAISCIH